MVDLAYNDESGQATVNIGRIDLNLRPLDNTTLSPPNVPTLELPCGVTITGSDFGQALRAARQVGDLVNLSLTESSFAVNVNGSTDSVHVEFSKDELVAIDCSAAARSQYSLTYLIPMAKIMQGIDNVNLRFGENFPLRITYDLADGAGHVCLLYTSPSPRD